MIRRWVTLVGAVLILGICPVLLTHPVRLEAAARSIVARAYGNTPE